MMPTSKHECVNTVNTFVIHNRDYLVFMETLGERVKKERAARGLSQEQLARKAGVRQSTIGNLESGARRAPRNLLEIAKALKVHPEWLQYGRGPKSVEDQAEIETIGTRIASKMKQRGFSEAQMVGKLGIPIDGVRRMIHEDQLDIDLLRKVCEVLSCTPNYLVTGEE